MGQKPPTSIQASTNGGGGGVGIMERGFVYRESLTAKR